MINNCASYAYLVAMDLPPKMLVWAELDGVCAVAPKIDAVLAGDVAFPNEPNEFDENKLLPAEKKHVLVRIFVRNENSRRIEILYDISPELVFCSILNTYHYHFQPHSACTR